MKGGPTKRIPQKYPWLKKAVAQHKLLEINSNKTKVNGKMALTLIHYAQITTFIPPTEDVTLKRSVDTNY
jgi:hypothetical protein